MARPTGCLRFMALFAFAAVIVFLGYHDLLFGLDFDIIEHFMLVFAFVVLIAYAVLPRRG